MRRKTIGNGSFYLGYYSRENGTNTATRYRQSSSTFGQLEQVLVLMTQKPVFIILVDINFSEFMILFGLLMLMALRIEHIFIILLIHLLISSLLIQELIELMVLNQVLQN